MVNGIANNCIIMSNTAFNSIGGGKVGGTANNCLVVGNMATGSGGNGGGMSSVTANNCTIVGNSASGAFGGGGLYNSTANNCIIWYNTAGTSNNVYGGTQDHTCSSDVTHGSDGNITNAPAFLNQPGGSYRLASDSPCIDTGTNSYVVGSIDLDELPRIMNVTVDMGAYEFVQQAVTLDHFVALDGAHVPPFINWITASTNIQAAVDAAVDGDTVLVANGSYLLTEEITVTNSITIESENGPNVTVVDGGGATRCFNLGGFACIISGLTITNGSAVIGGGIYCTTSVPMVTNCVISGNTAYGGGGSGNGGGMRHGWADNCIISENTAASSGGGMRYGVANNCVISGNTANTGGGKFSGTAFNCTIVGNEALGAFGGGGMYFGSAYNCVVWNNTATTNSNLASGSQLNTSSPDVTHGVDGNITNAPAFVDQPGSNYRLADGSPCIDTGTNGYWLGAVDLDGNSRILNGTVDMGAYEFVPVPPTNHYVALNGSHIAPYSYWATAATNIQSAVDVSLDGHRVHITNGTFVLTTEIVVATDIVIESVNGADVTIVDGGGASRCFNLAGSTCVVSGLTITNGYSSSGGGISGGIANNCTISGNEAFGGGGGGGMRSGTANNCIFIGNTATSAGGGTNSGGGGGMRDCIANNCTISGNSTVKRGGGMNNGTANNCIVWNNTAGNGGNNIFSGIQNYTCSPDVTYGVNGNITNAPAFVNYPGGDHRLAFYSPCIDAGTNGYVVVDTDRDGAPRIFGGTVDMGAYEYDSGTADSDGDGMTDGWEMLYFSSATGAVSSANGDTDPINNGNEFIAGTNPTNGASFFHISNAVHTTNGYVLSWDSVTGRVYTVQWAENLTNNLSMLTNGIAYPQNSYTDTVHAVDSQGFYQLEVELTP